MWNVQENDVKRKIGDYETAIVPVAAVQYGNLEYGIVVKGPEDSEFWCMKTLTPAFAATDQASFDDWLARLKESAAQAFQEFIDNDYKPVIYDKPFATTYNDATQYLRANMKLDIVDGAIVLTHK